jgi:hypothetical protein
VLSVDAAALRRRRSFGSVCRVACARFAGQLAGRNGTSRSRARFDAGMGRSPVCSYSLQLQKSASGICRLTRKLGRGRAGGRTASSKRATATSQGMPGDGPRRQSRGTGAEPEKGFSTMDGISGRTSHGSFTETWWTRPRPSVSGSASVSSKAAASGTRQGCQSRAGGSVAASSKELTEARPGAASRQRSLRRNDGRRSGPGEVKRTVRRPREQSRTKRHCRVERVLVFETWVAYVGLMYLGRTSAGRLTVLGDAGLAFRSSAGP